MTSPRKRAPGTLAASKRLAQAELTGLIDEGIEKALTTALSILGDPHAPPYTKMSAAKLFHAPMMIRLGKKTPTEEVTPQQRFLGLMREVRDVPVREVVVTDEEMVAVPVDDLPTFESDARADASAS
jgi:hypothetical protein